MIHLLPTRSHIVKVLFFIQLRSFFLILYILLATSLTATLVHSQSPLKNSHCQLSHHSRFNLLQSIFPTSSGYSVNGFLTLKSSGFVISNVIWSLCTSYFSKSLFPWFLLLPSFCSSLFRAAYRADMILKWITEFMGPHK